MPELSDEALDALVQEATVDAYGVDRRLPALGGWPVREYQGRNQPCLCGSGKKFKEYYGALASA